MSDYDTLVGLINDERIDAGLATNKDLGVKFCLSMTRYAWRYGTLSEGHERITDAQRYFAANREIYSISNGLEEQRFAAMTAKADLLEAEAMPTETEVQKLRAAAAIGQAKARIRRALDNCQDALRGLDEMCRVKNELEAAVMAKYPQGIEQAEPDNWRAIAEYRIAKQLPGQAPYPLDSIPMPAEHKARLGAHYGRPDAMAALAIANSQALTALPSATVTSISKVSE